MNNEIRFSLRSIEKYLPHARVFIVGECPEFVQNVIHIPAIDPYENKLSNAIFKIRAACREFNLSEKFILMNDDFFFLNNVSRIENYILGTIVEAISLHSTKVGYYYNSMKVTRDLLVQTGFNSPLNHEAHTPMILEKHKFLELTNAIDWEKEGYLFRSLYGNIYDVGGKKRLDTKVYHIEQLQELSKKDILSSSDRVVLCPEFQHFIFNKFPNPSRYENPEMDPGRMP